MIAAKSYVATNYQFRSPAPGDRIGLSGRWPCLAERDRSRSAATNGTARSHIAERQSQDHQARDLSGQAALAVLKDSH